MPDRQITCLSLLRQVNWSFSHLFALVSFSQVLYLAIGSFFVTLSSADGSTLSQLDLGTYLT